MTPGRFNAASSQEVNAMPAIPRRLAVSYSRFSDPVQAKGDSETRQAEMFRAFCQRHNLTPLREVFADKGRSGYTDEHRKRGRLGQLVAMAKDGAFDPGTVIVVEAWDRLGRLRPDKQTDLIAELLRTGVRIGICRLDDIFAEDDFGTHKWTTLAVFVQLAYQESKQKAERVAHSWEKRRERAREEGTLLTGQVPAWIKVVNGEPRLIPERRAALKRIFQLAGRGVGYTRIVGKLTEEKVPPFGEVVVNEGRSRSQFSGQWCRSYVTMILNDRRAIGELQPKKADGSPDGPPLPHYYPAAVSEEEFLLAKAGQEERRNYDKAGRRSAPRQGRHVNVFRGLLKHARDGEGFVLHNNGTKTAPVLLLMNTSGVKGRGRCYSFPYPIFEEAVLRLLREVDPKDVLPKEGEAPSRADVLRAKLENVRRDIAGLKEDLQGGYSKTLAAVLRTKEGEEEEVAGELQEELARSVRPAARAWQELPGLMDLVRTGGDEARLRLRPVLRRVIEDARVLIVPRGGWRVLALQLHFVGGAVRDYLILRQLAANHRPGGWWARSLADVATPGAFDLRRPADAARLESWLAAADVAELRRLLQG
jgi:DNA invertase Pin-like site-specific DNA recombinase